MNRQAVGFAWQVAHASAEWALGRAWHFWHDVLLE
jgi:hypothetical protein